MSTTILIIGAYGKMGSITCDTISNTDGYKLIGKLKRTNLLSEAIQTKQPDIIIDFSNANAVYQNTVTSLSHKIKTIVGASGLTPEQVSTLSKLAKENKTGCIIAPNFSIGAILMMKFSAMAATFFSEAEVIELHHQQKLDAPSGTAVKTANMIKAARVKPKNSCASEELYQGARGANVSDVNIHSLRLPGYIASQQVVFGGSGENLKIEHNSINRECFMPGVLLACKKIQTLDHLIYGLENLL